jgi:hypothetical protein
MFLSEPLKLQHVRRQVIGQYPRTGVLHSELRKYTTKCIQYALVVYLSAQIDRNHVKGLNRFKKTRTKLRRLDSTAGIHVVCPSYSRRDGTDAILAPVRKADRRGIIVPLAR